MNKKLVQTAEGRILFAGICLFLLLVIIIGWNAAVNPSAAKVLSLTFLVNALGGRAAGVGICIMNNYGAAVTILYNFYIEMMVACFSYSLFVLTAKNRIRITWMRDLMRRIADRAARHKDKIETYGWAGIFLFVMLPLPITGPVIGSVIGHMIRIGLVRTFTAAASGSLLSTVIWFFCFDFLEQRFKVIQYILAGIIILVVISKFNAIRNFLFKKE